jgi:MFS family permease
MDVMLLAMRGNELMATPRVRRGKGQVRAGFVHAAGVPELRRPLLQMGVVGLLAFNFPTVLPLVARFSFHGSATTYAIMTNCLGIGALVGTLVIGSRRSVAPHTVAAAALAFGLTLGLTAAAPVLGVALVLLVGVGAASVVFSASVQATLQLAVAPDLRGRVLALYQMVYQGTTPVGALIVGSLASVAGPRSCLVLGGVAAAGVGVLGLRSPLAVADPLPGALVLGDASDEGEHHHDDEARHEEEDVGLGDTRRRAAVEHGGRDRDARDDSQLDEHLA